MTAKWRVKSGQGCYLALDATPQLLELGADFASAKVYGIKAPIYSMLGEGTEFESDCPAGPHLEPLNDEARDAMRAYFAGNPGATLDPTGQLSATIGNGVDLDRALMATLDSMLREAEVRPSESGEVAALRMQVAELTGAKASSNDLLLKTLVEGQAAMTQAMTALLAALTHPPGKKS